MVSTELGHFSNDQPDQRASIIAHVARSKLSFLAVFFLVLCSMLVLTLDLNSTFGQDLSKSTGPSSELTINSPLGDQIQYEAHLHEYALQVEKLTTLARTDLETRLNFKIRQLKIYLDDDEPSMRRRAQKDHGFTPPRWSAGLAYPSRGQIYLPLTHQRALLPLIKHELTHIALGPSPLPLWVNEGVAVSLGEGLSWQRVWTLNEAAAQAQLHRFEDLISRFPKSGQPASIAYAQSAHFINELRTRFGSVPFSRWLNSLREGMSLELATQKHFKTDFWKIERRWRRGLERGIFAWLSVFAKSETLWSLTLMLFVVLGLRKIKRRAQRSISDIPPLKVHVARPSNYLKTKNIFNPDSIKETSSEDP